MHPTHNSTTSTNGAYSPYTLDQQIDMDEIFNPLMVTLAPTFPVPPPKVELFEYDRSSFKSSSVGSHEELKLHNDINAVSLFAVTQHGFFEAPCQSFCWTCNIQSSEVACKSKGHHNVEE